jgi:hypothetical protein
MSRFSASVNRRRLRIARPTVLADWHVAMMFASPQKPSPVTYCF